MSAITQHSCYDGFFDVVTATLEPTSFSVNTHTHTRKFRPKAVFISLICASNLHLLPINQITASLDYVKEFFNS